MAIKEKKPTSAKPAGPPPDFDIDLGAALPPGPPPKRGRGRPALPGGPAPKPRTSTRKVRSDKGQSKKTGKAPTAPYIDNTYISNIRGDSSMDNREQGEFRTATDLKGKMTTKELSFLSSYLSGGVTIDNAMVAAGYGDFTKDWRYKLAQKIVIKYESQAGDHRIIFRAMGAGEVAVVEGLLKLAQGSKSDMVRLNAWSMIAKCIGLTKEQIEGQAGITIIFEGTASQAQPAALALPAREQEQAQPATYAQPVRVLQITK